MKRVLLSVIAILFIGFLAPKAYAQAGCTSQSQSTNLNALRDGQAPGSITPQAIRNLACSQGWNYIVPTNTSADVTTLQNAVNGSQPVLMAPGFWQICSQVSLPVNQRLEGLYTLSNPGSFGPQTSYSKTILSCPTNGSFSSGQAFLALQDHDQVRGLDIYCNSGSSPTFNNINALNAISVEIDHNNLYFCKEGIDRFSNGSVPGASTNISQLAHIHDNLFYGQTDHGIRADGVNGGFVSDEYYGPANDFVVIQSASALYMNSSGGNQIIGNRFEDAATSGIELVGSFETTVTGNICDQIICVKINNSGNISVVGNGGHASVEFAGASTNIQFSGNSWQATPIYTVDSGGTLDAASTINEQPAAPTATSTLFANAYTQSILQPLMGTNNGAVAAIAPNLSLMSQNPGGHISTRGFTPAVSSCGTSPSVSGGDATGIITTGSGTVTACTLTFAVPYTYAPTCTPVTSSTSSNASLSSGPSTTAFTVNLSASLASGKIYYTCIEQSPNQSPAGVGLPTASWTAGNATLTNNAGTDPLGGSTAAKLTVDTANNRHKVAATFTGAAAGTSTVSAYFHAGTAGTEDPAIVVWDSGLSNSIGGVWSLTDGSFLGQVHQGGTGALISAGSQNVGSGWWRVWMTFTLGSGVVPSFDDLEAAQGSSDFYTGNGTDNLLVWGAAMRPGSLP